MRREIEVIKALGLLGFRILREREHIALVRDNPDGTQTPLTIPNHARLKARRYAQSARTLASRELLFSERMSKAKGAFHSFSDVYFNTLWLMP